MAKKSRRIKIGVTPDGKEIRKRFYGSSDAEINDKIVAYKLERSKTANPSDISFKRYSKQWFDTYKANKSKATRDMYDRALDKCSALDGFRINQVTKTMCQKVVSAEWEHPRTAGIVKLTLNQIFKCAVNDGIIAINPAASLDVPKYKATEKRILTEKEETAFREADLNEQDRLFVTIMMTFGLRPGEALALTRQDFNFKTMRLSINKALALSLDNTSEIKATKTEETREIPIPKALKSRLADVFRANSGFSLFTKEDGGLYTKSAYRRMSERILKAVNKQLKGNDNLNMIQGITIYTLRHHRATQLYYLCQEGKISTKQAAAYMGHHEEVFLRTYSHIDPKKENIDDLYRDVAL